MSRLRKLFKDPIGFSKDAFAKRGYALPSFSKNNDVPTYFAFGFSPWKAILRANFPDRHIQFYPTNISRIQFFGEVLPRLRKNSQSKILIWGMKAPDYVLHEVRQRNLPTLFVEDGFIRSIELGSKKTPPLSLTLDSRSPYFDSTRETDLEILLRQYEVAPDLAAEAEKLIDSIKRSNISKYNYLEDIDVSTIYGPKNRRRILVLGQVETDASLTFGSVQGHDVETLISTAIDENPSAQIIFKPHPEQDLSKLGSISNRVLFLEKSISLPSSFKTIDHVYTLTSLGGLEALIHGISVTTMGAPFYSNWGLTDDRVKISRRSRDRSLKELVAISYIVYPKYFHPFTGQPSECWATINYLSSTRRNLHRDSSDLSKSLLNQRQYEEWSLPSLAENSKLLVNANSISAPEYVRLERLARRAGIKIVNGSFRLPVDAERIYGILQSGLENIKISIDREPLRLIFGSSAPIHKDTEIPLLACLKPEVSDISLQRLHMSLLIETGNWQDALKLSLEDPCPPANLNPSRIALDGGIYTPEVISKIPSVSSAYESKPNDRDLQYYLRKIWRIVGVTSFSKELFEQAATKRETLHFETLMLLAAFFVEAGKVSVAVELAQRAALQERASWKWTRYAALSNVLFQEGLTRDNWAAEDSELYHQLVENSGRFETMVGRYKHSLAIVGNSPILRGMHRGPEIDGKDLIIRFNSAVRDYPFALDTGKKLDILVLNPDFTQTSRMDFSKVPLAVISDGDLYGSKNLHAKLKEIRSKCQVQLLNSAVDRTVVSKIQSTPSSGLKTLYWIYSIFGPIPRSCVYGFSLNDQGAGTATSYSKDTAIRLPVIHNWQAEASLFEQLLTSETQFLT